MYRLIRLRLYGDAEFVGNLIENFLFTRSEIFLGLTKFEEICHVP